MEKLVLDGVTYVKASVAARNAGYTSDYLGQLCRGGKIDAKLVGRTWYINPDELKVHQVEKRRVARVKAREQVRKSLAEYKDKNQPKQRTVAQYEPDESDLIPAIRKIVPEVLVSREEQRIGRRQIAQGDDFTIENKGNSVVMSGELSVVDAEEETVDTDSIILSPKIIRTKKTSRDVHPDEGTDNVVENLTEDESLENGQGSLDKNPDSDRDVLSQDFNFLDRLAETGAIPKEDAADKEVLHEEFLPMISISPTENVSTGWFWVVSVIIVGLLGAFAQVAVSGVSTITSNSGVYSVERSFQIELNSIKNLLK